MTIDKAVSMYLLQLQADGRSVHTIAQYRRHVGLLARWVGERDVCDLTHQDLARFLVSPVATHCADGTPKKATTLNAIRSSLRTFFGYLHAAGLVAANPARLVRRAQCGSAPPRGLSDDEQRRLLDVLARAKDWQGRRDHALIHLLAASGIRLSSALALEAEDIDVERGEVLLRHAKGDRAERVVLTTEITRHLAAYLSDRPAGALWISRHGCCMSGRQVQRRLSQWLRRAGIEVPLAPHALRHGFGLRLYRETRDVLLVKAALGHRSIASTVVYARATQDDVRAALDGLDARDSRRLA